MKRKMKRAAAIMLSLSLVSASFGLQTDPVQAESSVDETVGALSTDSADLDVSSLADGTYTVTGKMLKVDRSTTSMSNAAINSEVTLSVENGEYYIILDFQGITIGSEFGYLGTLSYYLTGYTTDTYGNPVGELEEVTVLSRQTDENGDLIVDDLAVKYGYDTDGYPDLVKFPLISEALEDGVVPLHVFVPVMEEVYTGCGDQDAYLVLDWDTLDYAVLDLSDAEVTLDADSYTYTGSAIKPGVTVTLDGEELTENEDYTVSYANNKDYGTATVTVTGIEENYYTGSASATFTIAKKSISSGSVSLSYTSCTYSGSAKKPTPTVKVSVGGKTKTLTKGTDYTVKYSSNTNAGTATVTITGTGNYKGTLTKKFTINKKKQSLTVKTSTKTVKYSKVKKAKQTVKAITSVSGAKGTKSYKWVSGSSKLSVNSSTGKITVKKGTKKGTYKIKVKVTSKATTNYSSGSKTVTVTVKVK